MRDALVLGACLVLLGFATNLALYLLLRPTWSFLAGDALSVAGAGLGAVGGWRGLEAGHVPAAAAGLVVLGVGVAFPIAFHARIQTPAGGLKLRPGDPHPELELFDVHGERVRLRDLWGPNGALCVWYRGFW